MSVPAGYVRARRSNRCPVCGKPDWCLVAEDGATAVCARVASSKPFGDAGWLHRLTDDAGKPVPLPAWSAARRAELARARAAADLAEAEARAAIDFPALAARFAAAMTADLAGRLADDLGLSAGVLRELGVGVAHGYRMVRREDEPVTINAWSFPMRSGAGEVVGLTFRTPRGDKFRHTYSDNHGLFVPAGIKPLMGPAGVLFSPEGPTSCAAMRCLGLRAVGRPNNRIGAAHLAEYCRRLRPCRLVLLGDNDRQFNEAAGRWIHPGLEGAEACAAEIRPRVPCTVDVVLPPEGVKDARVWYRLGAGRGDVLARIREARAVTAAGEACA